MNNPPDAPARLTVYYDGLCPICRREIDWVRRRDKARALQLVDFAAADFNAGDAGIPEVQLMQEIHAQAADGEVLRGVEVFRQMYSLIGMGWLLAWTKWPLARPIANTAYRAFAALRPRLSAYRLDDKTCDRCGAH
jgi:predicted DCC family thiol-disulfide oxidoreductase YuxK